MSQGQVSNYVRGEAGDVPTVLVRAIEDLSGREPGWVYVQAGLVKLPQTLEEMADVDPDLADEFRAPLKTMIRSLHEETRKARRRPTK